MNFFSGSPWRKSGRLNAGLNACPTLAHNVLSHEGGTGAFACADSPTETQRIR